LPRNADKACIRFKSPCAYYEVRVIYRRRKNGEHQLVVPKILVKDVIALNHDTILAEYPVMKLRLEIFAYVIICQE
jgi:hypothetical protein